MTSPGPERNGFSRYKGPTTRRRAIAWAPFTCCKMNAAEDFKMSIKFPCACGKRYSTDKRHIGKRFKCANCGSEFLVPDTSINHRGQGQRAAPRASSEQPSPESPSPLRTQAEASGPTSGGLSETAVIPNAPERNEAASASRFRSLIPMWITVVVLNACIIGVALHVAGALKHLSWPAMLTTKPKGKNGWMLPFSGSASLTTREIVESAESSIAQIKGTIGSGTGFLIGKNLLATNAHVVDGELITDLSINFPSAEKGKQGPYAPKRLLLDDRNRDIAILSLNDCPLPPLRMARSYTFQRGDDVTIIGSPGLGSGASLQNAISKGILSTETTLDGARYYQLGASVNPGNSGGPVLANDGKVIGMISSRAARAEALGFCIPIEDLAAASKPISSLTEQQVANVEKRHAARVAYVRMMAIGNIYAASLNDYASAVQDALEEREAIGPRVTSLIKNRAPEAERLHNGANIVIRPILVDIINDNEFPEGTRRDLQELWATCSDMRDFVVAPKDPFVNYRTRTSELRSRFDHLVEKLSIPLGKIR